jgi:hypothetical protein
LRGRAPMRLNGQMVKKYELQMKPVTPATGPIIPPPAFLPPPPDATGGPAPL